MKRVKREELLSVLESVQPGLSSKPIVEQSSCFVFTKKNVVTFNDEVACRKKCDLGFEGAVQAVPLLSLLRKLPEDELEIEVKGNEFLVKGKRRTSGIGLEAQILLPIESMEKPGEWKPLPEDFQEAIGLASLCVGKDESKYWETCVHLHPKYIEAGDNDQFTRFKIKTPFDGPSLVRGASIKHIVELDMTEFSDTKTWLHFRNPSGLIISCRRDVSEEYKDISQILELEDGKQTTLPRGLSEAAEKAEIFSAENPDDNQVQIELKPGKLRIRGEGVSGWYSEVKKIKYTGPAMVFRMSPKLLGSITKRHNDCFIGDGKLRVASGKFVYVACLNAPEDQEASSNDEASGEDD